MLGKAVIGYNLGMKNKKKPKSKAKAQKPAPAVSTEELLCDFGDFGTLSRANISDLFVDIHASVSPLDPLNKMKADAEVSSY